MGKAEMEILLILLFLTVKSWICLCRKGNKQKQPWIKARDVQCGTPALSTALERDAGHFRLNMDRTPY